MHSNNFRFICRSYVCSTLKFVLLKDSRQSLFRHDFPSGLLVKNLPAMQAAEGLIPGSRRHSGEGNGNPL